MSNQTLFLNTVQRQYPYQDTAFYELFWDQVHFFEPAYLADGCNGCRIYYDNGLIEEVHARLEWVLNDWASFRATSKELLQKQAAGWTREKRQRRVPLVVNKDICLIPVKCRKLQNRYETASGYAVLQKISGMQVMQDAVP